MHTRQELEEMSVIHLAVQCGTVADNKSMDAATATKANELKWEWAKLGARNTPGSPKERDQLEAEKQALKKRMVDFLAHV